MLSLAILAVVTGGKFHGGAQLVSSRRTVTPGSSFEVAVRIDLDPGWHTYWRNPGDAGIPPRIVWHLPRGWKASDIRWPVPHKLVAPEVVSYGYEHQALLLVRLTAPASAPFGSKAVLKSKVDWLVCQEGCIPASAEVQTTIRVGHSSAPDSVWGPAIEKAIRRLPGSAADNSLSATLSGQNIVLSFSGSPSSVTFFPSDPVVEPSAPQILSTSGKLSSLTLKLSQYAPGGAPASWFARFTAWRQYLVI